MFEHLLNADPKELWRRYVLAIALICAAVVGSHLANFTSFGVGANLAQAVNESGRQRMLSQRITFYATQYTLSEDSLKRVRGLSQMRSALALFMESHQNLIDRPNLSAELRENYFSNENQPSLDNMVREFSAMANRLPSLSVEDQQVTLQKIQDLAQKPILDRLDQAVHQFEATAKAADDQLSNISMISFALAILSICFVAGFIFLPAHRITVRALSQLEQKTSQLKNDQNRLTKALDAKTAFLSKISHEIRTPLNGISAGSELLEHEQISDDVQEYISIITQSTGELSDTVDKLLFAAQGPKIDLTNSVRNIYQEFDTILEAVSKETGGQNLSTNLVVAKNLPATAALPWEAVQSCLQHLLNNAFKFTSDGSISIQASHENSEAGQMLRIDVSDTGIGLRSDDLDRIFEEFEQAENGAGRSYDGLGLGLTHANAVAQAFGGSIDVTSTFGTGSCFTLKIPLTVQHHNKLNDTKGIDFKLDQDFA